MPQPVMLKRVKLKGSMKIYIQDLLELIPPKDVLFIIGDWNAKDIGRQAIKDIVL